MVANAAKCPNMAELSKFQTLSDAEKKHTHVVDRVRALCLPPPPDKDIADIANSGGLGSEEDGLPRSIEEWAHSVPASELNASNGYLRVLRCREGVPVSSE